MYEKMEEELESTNGLVVVDYAFDRSSYPFLIK